MIKVNEHTEITVTQDIPQFKEEDTGEIYVKSKDCKKKVKFLNLILLDKPKKTYSIISTCKGRTKTDFWCRRFSHRCNNLMKRHNMDFCKNLRTMSYDGRQMSLQSGGVARYFPIKFDNN